MKKQGIIVGITLLLLAAPGLGPGVVAEEVVYGRDLMTKEELKQHRAKMRSFKTEEERKAYRREHHKRMQQRAKKRGVKLPAEPGPRGKGMGRGARDGRGPGPRQGRGRGR